MWRALLSQSLGRKELSVEIHIPLASLRNTTRQLQTVIGLGKSNAVSSHKLGTGKLFSVNKTETIAVISFPIFATVKKREIYLYNMQVLVC
jgi:hypothetical protein